ncbi:hypothetical protein TNCV_3041941 [Trichonephila clavipes]|nr:hypothetical protein TNCV_3041941 [Trichonephila clavipes]
MPPVVGVYEGNRLSAALIGTSSRRDEMILAMLRSEHTRAQRHVASLTNDPLCPTCNVTQATPSHTSRLVLVNMKASCSHVQQQFFIV